jgi:lipid II:glycine glycyltransferase (peptidoglycan interpeptide bridge formation enzyme)
MIGIKTRREQVAVKAIKIMSNSEWEVEVDRSSSTEWSEMLDQFADANIYQTAAYGEVRWGAKNLSRLVLKLNGQAVAMAQFRIIRPTPLKFGIAYLRWGPIWERRGQVVDVEVPQRMVKAIEDEYLSARRLCVRILPNAFAGSARAGIFESAFAKFTSEGAQSADSYRTFLVDLTPSLEALRASLDAKWRNKLKQAEKNQLTVTAGSGVAEFKAFTEMYFQMLKRKDFDTTVSVEEFAAMQAALGDSERMQVWICESKGTPVAGLVVSALGESAIYLLGATSDAGLESRGAYLLQWTAMQWLKGQGVRTYDLGGIDPEKNPGVYRFKRGFSGADICQISSLIASESAVSFGLAKASFALKSRIRSGLRPLIGSRVEKKAVATN